MKVKNKEVTQYINKTLMEEFSIENPIKENDNLMEILDSLDIVNFLFHIEEHFNIRIPDEELEDPEMLRIDKITEYIMDRI